MRLHHHTIASSVVSVMLFVYFKSWGLAIGSFISGIFIDLDHIIDVIREHGWSIKTKDFFMICNNGQFDRVFLYCHGWEWSFLFLITAWVSGWNPWLLGISIGLIHHLILDTIYNSSNPYSYSFLWRWKHDFAFDKIFTKLINLKYNYRKQISAEINKS